MTETKRERPLRMEDWNEGEMCHWLRLVDLAEAAAMIERLAAERDEETETLRVCREQLAAMKARYWQAEQDAITARGERDEAKQQLKEGP